jgi:hypothetical protein
MKRIAAVLAAVLVLAACTKDDPKPPPRIDGVREFPGLDHTHVKDPVTYPQAPPVGGPHAQAWLRCAVYDAPVPNENAVHSMEHGAVWVTYRPDLSADDLTIVKRLQGLKPAYVVISPYAGLPSPVVASAWGLQLAVDKADDPRLAAFVKAYAGGGQGGEPGTRCDNGATPEQLRAAATPAEG